MPCIGIKTEVGRNKGKMAINIIPYPTPITAVIPEVNRVINPSIISFGMKFLYCKF